MGEGEAQGKPELESGWWLWSQRRVGGGGAQEMQKWDFLEDLDDQEDEGGGVQAAAQEGEG